MTRLLGLALAASTALSVSALAAPQPERVRGVIRSVDADSVTVQPLGGADLRIALGDKTKYVSVLKADLSEVTQGSYIGTAVKSSGKSLVALEVVVFPPAMRGTGEGHYPWDKLPDSTAANGGSVASSMTNGNVAAASSADGARKVSSTMTNGNVQSASEQSGAKRITVTYKGGKETILVPPTVPVVTLQPADRSAVTQGARVFIVAANDNGHLTANFVAVGKDGVKPPM